MECQVHEQAKRIFRTVRLLQGRMARTRYEAFHTNPPCAELTLRQMNTLMVIHERGEVCIKELAEALNVSPPSASAMVDRLLELNLVAREPCQEDRREVRVCLSGRGAEYAREMEGHFLALISELIERVGEECAAQWCGVYDRLYEVLKAFEDPADGQKAGDRL